MVYKPTYNWGAPSCMEQIFQANDFFIRLDAWMLSCRSWIFPAFSHDFPIMTQVQAAGRATDPCLGRSLRSTLTERRLGAARSGKTTGNYRKMNMGDFHGI